MRMLDKERKKKKYKDSEPTTTSSSSYVGFNQNDNDNDRRSRTSQNSYETSRYAYRDDTESRHHNSDNYFNNLQENDTNNKYSKRNKSENSNSIQTEIRTADFVVRLL